MINVGLTPFQLRCERALIKKFDEMGIADVTKTLGELKSNFLPGGAGTFVRFDRLKPAVTIWIYDDEGMISVDGHEYVFEAADYPSEDYRAELLVESGIRCVLGQLPKDDGTASIVLYPPKE